jgi:uncharacterized protein involved in outer membrane biogenesis
MRRLLLGVILLLLCGALGLYTLDLLLSSNKFYVLRFMEQRLGRKISARQVRATYIPDIGLRFEDFAIADDPAYSNDVFLNVNRFQVSFQFLPLVKQQLRVRKMVLHEVVVNIVRNKAGAYNFASLGVKAKSQGSIGGSQKTSATNVAAALTLIPSIEVANGRIRYFDENDGSDFTVTQLDLRIAELENENSLQLHLAMSVFAEKQNIHLKTSLGPLTSHNLRDLPFDGELNADRVDMSRIRAALPLLRKELPRALDLRGVYTISNLRFRGTLNKPLLKGAVEGTDASFRFE